MSQLAVTHLHDIPRFVPVVMLELTTDHQGPRFRFVSEGSRTVLGLDPRSLMEDYRLLYSVVPESESDRVARLFSSQPVQGETSVSFHVRDNNGLRAVELRYCDQLVEGGLVRRAYIIAQETNAHAFPDEDYEELFEKLPLAVILHCEGTILFANAEAHRLAKARKKRELIGMDILALAHPSSKPRIADRLVQLNLGESVPAVEERLVCFDGSETEVESTAFPFNFKGRQAILVILRNIGEKKKKEAEIRKNETLFAQLFQNLPMAVVMLDDTGRVAQINRGFEAMFGYNINELRGRNLNDYIVPPDLQSEGIDLNNLIVSQQVVSIETVRRHRSGNVVNVLLCGVPVVQDNEAIAIYGVYVDITDRKKVEEELKIRNAELDNFVYKVSHDLRAPLSSILGLVNLTRFKENDDDPRDYIELIGEKIQALDNFISDVLSHSKNLKMDVEIAKVDLDQIIQQTFVDLGYLKGADRVRRTVRIAGIEFYSDPWRIAEIFRNLISNAIKYRRPDADDSEIVIKINVDHLCADITFSDNGIGIKDSRLTRIFEMFYRATDQADGSGIGLYIVKNAVEKLGGEVRVVSRPGEGTRFHILLPNRVNSIITNP